MNLFSRQIGARLLNRLSFRYKLMLLPLMAAVGFVVVLGVSTYFAMRNQNLLSRVETGYYPAVDASEKLNNDLTAIQRGLQDAVSAANPAALADVDKLRDRFQSILREELANPVADTR